MSEAVADAELWPTGREPQKIAVFVRLFVLSVVEVPQADKRLERPEVCRIGVDQPPMCLQASL